MGTGMTVLAVPTAGYLAAGVAITASPLVRCGVLFSLIGFRPDRRLSARERAAYTVLICGVVLAWPLLVTGALAAAPLGVKPRSLWHAVKVVRTDLRDNLCSHVPARRSDPADAREMTRRILKDYTANSARIRLKATYAAHVPLEKRLELDRQLRGRPGEASE